MKRPLYKKLLYLVTINAALLYSIQQWPIKLLTSYSNQNLNFMNFNDINENNLTAIKSIKRFVVKKILIDTNALACSHVPRPSIEDVEITEGRWQVDRQGYEKLYLYSSFYDDRPLAGTLPTIRVLTMATNGKRMDVYCHVWFDDYSDEAFVIRADVQETGMNSFIYEYVGRIGEFTISCQLPFKYLHITDDPVLVRKLYNSSCDEFFDEVDNENELKIVHTEHEKTLLVCNKRNINEKKHKFIPRYVSLSRGVLCKTPKQPKQSRGFNHLEKNFFYHYQKQQHNPTSPHPVNNVTKTIYLTTLLPVYYDFHEEPLHEFSICVANGHDRYESYQLLEWFEFYKLMGVKEFYLYNTSYIGVESLFKYYQSKGTLLMSQIPHPLGLEPRDEKKIEKIRNLRTISLNDCMMRNMYRSKYLVVVDHDEFIVPRGDVTNFHDLLLRAEKRAKERDRPVMSYGFLNTYFFLSFKPDKYKSNNFRTFRFLYRTISLPPYTASKSILSPLYCFNLMNHYCYTRLPLYNGSISIFVSEDLALSQHYRFCGKFYLFETCTQLHNTKMRDETMLKFEKVIRENVYKVAAMLE
ncbi:hypothetical protein HELRODRAFT_179276 [Helobdella robusta]|uniref:Glycosyltransferase family 92 protein n=1 Tax=Helobdella robusta TaxID=6412 RepID=T1FEG9_HELRO|nr:hypothetical protein HELRODRAFT_179276 [Helobdella robusta]ESN95502.1 hypothetical protein HELRODRAFT_179276 [Helobdella robusta]